MELKINIPDEVFKRLKEEIKKELTSVERKKKILLKIKKKEKPYKPQTIIVKQHVSQQAIEALKKELFQVVSKKRKIVLRMKKKEYKLKAKPSIFVEKKERSVIKKEIVLPSIKVEYQTFTPIQAIDLPIKPREKKEREVKIKLHVEKKYEKSKKKICYKYVRLKSGKVLKIKTEKEEEIPKGYITQQIPTAPQQFDFSSLAKVLEKLVSKEKEEEMPKIDGIKIPEV